MNGSAHHAQMDSLLSQVEGHYNSQDVDMAKANQIETLHAKAADFIRQSAAAHARGDYQSARSHLHSAAAHIGNAAVLQGIGQAKARAMAIASAYR